MDDKKIFGLVLRCTSVWLIIWGSWNLLAALSYLLFNESGYFSYLWYGAPAVAGGIKLLRSSESVINFTYNTKNE